MGKLPRGFVWLIGLCLAAFTAAAGISSGVVYTASPETLRFRASSLIWLNVIVQASVLAVAASVAIRLWGRDRGRRAAEARTQHLAELALLSGGLAHEIRN